MSRVRRATLKDIDKVAKMGADFVNSAKLPEASIDEYAKFAASVIESENGVCLMTDRGGILGMIAPLYYKPSYMQAHELAWWGKGDGVALFKAFEAWAKEAGAAEIIMSALHPSSGDAVQRFYERRGYTLRDLGFVRRL